MLTLTLKNIPTHLHARLKESAEKNRRSLNSEILARLERERDPIADRFVGAALEHPAIDEDLRAIGLEEVLGAGDRPCRAEEMQTHASMMPR